MTAVERTEPVAVDTVVTGEWMITLNADREIYRDGAIAVAGGVITEVGKRDAILAKYRPATLIDEPRSIVIPGMVNGHRHLLCCAKGAMPEGGQNPVRAAPVHLPLVRRPHRGRHGCLRAARGRRDDPVRDDAVRGAGLQPPRRRARGARRLGHPGPDRDRLREGIQTVRKFGHPRILDAVTIEGVGTCSDALNRGAADLARAYDSLFVLHKSTSQAEVELELRVFGERPVAHMDTIGALHDRVLLNHMTSLDERDVEVICASGARISQNPTSALKLAKGTTQTGKWKELATAGVPMALGTDAENVSNHTDICRAMQLAALLPRDATRDPNAVSAEQALEMATLGGATALRMQDQVGSLEPGKQADIVVFDTDNFDLRPLHNPVANIVYGSTGHSVDTVLIGGEIVLRHKQLTSLDEQQLRHQVESVNRRVLGEIGIAPLPQWPIV